MSDRHDAFSTDRSSELARLAVAAARKRMIAAAARPIAVKWRAMRRGDRFGSIKQPDAASRDRPPG
ncbi:MAG: hypothetical protein JWO86_3415 [Myxococcaceae bacterium]|jgi:hypothetical protein|nr:hypothetical protein [Myxococcaceae bacterium]MEA2750326.1 hypothetical protein [Myxococcales bacterium]